MFRRCVSLISLPDISKWNFSNAEIISGIFYKCNSLISLPYLPKPLFSAKGYIINDYECFNCLNKL